MTFFIRILVPDTTVDDLRETQVTSLFEAGCSFIGSTDGVLTLEFESETQPTEDWDRSLLSLVQRVVRADAKFG